jgi:hypothetical protein
VSRHEPTLGLSLGYDDSSGLFADGSAIATRTPDGEVGLLAGTAALGYAWRLKGGKSLDLGVLRTEYSGLARYGRPLHYSELFAGLTGRSFALRASFSPDYVWDNTKTVYLSAEVTRRPAEKWRITGRGGLFALLEGGPPRPTNSVQYDWSVSVARQLGPFDAQVELSGGGPDPDYFDGIPHSKTAAAGRITFNF